MKVNYFTQVLKQEIITKTMCPNYIIEFRNTRSHLLKIYLGEWITQPLMLKLQLFAHILLMLDSR